MSREMRQTAKLLATVAAIAALALPGAALAGQRPSVHTPPGVHRPSHGQGKPYLRALVPFNGYGWPVVIPASGESDLVTHDFVDPMIYPPPHRFPRSIEILSDEPAFDWKPPHIIELGRHRRHRRPIAVVRRGVVSEE